MRKRRKESCIAELIVLLVLIMASCSPAAGDAVIIEYTRSGGIAGFHEELEIREDRSAILRSDSQELEFMLQYNRYERLIAALEQVDFKSLSDQYLPESNCCDLFDYTIQYRGSIVHTMTTAVPAELEQILIALDEIVSDRLTR